MSLNRLHFLNIITPTIHHPRPPLNFLFVRPYLGMRAVDIIVEKTLRQKQLDISLEPEEG